MIPLKTNKRSMYLLDTNVLSETRKPKCNAGVKHWFDTTDPRLWHLSVVTIAEIRFGIEQLRRRSANGDATRIEEWLTRLRSDFADRILSITPSVSDRWGRLENLLGHGGEDVMIGATAFDHGLVVVTRNVKDFTPMGVKVENPFS